MGVNIYQKRVVRDVMLATVSHWIRNLNFRTPVMGLRLGREVVQREKGGVV